MTGPLTDVRVIELAGLGPAPYAGQLLADLGAEVIVIARPGPPGMPIEARGKKSVVLDLKNPEAVEAVLKLVETADILTEGFRPGVTEKLGLGPDACLARNPRLVYGRMTGWGQTGPWARKAGHDINYIGLTGVLHAMGDRDRSPPPPLNLVGDYGGGSMFLIMGVLAALHAAQRTGRGDVVDAAIVDGALSMFGIQLSLDGLGLWRSRRGANLLDGGMPYYRCYTCKDGRFFAVGALEPQFFAALLEGLQIAPDAYGKRDDPGEFARQHALLEARFAEKTRDEWASIFEDSDACATPVLDYDEARAHPHMKARASIVEAGGFKHPNIAPRLSSMDADFTPPPVAPKGGDTAAILKSLGYGDDAIARLDTGPGEQSPRLVP